MSSSSRTLGSGHASHSRLVSVQEYDELVELQAKLEEKLQELEANPPR